ncbi:MAG: HAD family hydrolase [Lachnospiraceae bacterium]|nr:HAD family hydrolase [Lachnospiraceae bacterium]
MIRFIISDVDGTLIQDESNQVSERILEQIPELKEKGVLFGVASGRNYDELKKLFGPVKNDILYITNNGAVAIFDDEVVYKQPIDRRLAIDIVKDVKAQDGCDCFVTGEKASYIPAKNLVFKNYMKTNMQYEDAIEVDELYQVREEITKISVRQNGGVTQDMVDYFFKKWGAKAQIAISGREWIDFTAPGVNKGFAVETIQRLYQISMEDTMTFGDNYNDIEMFARSYFSYAMQDAHPDIRNAAKHIAPDVETIIDDVLRM